MDGVRLALVGVLAKHFEVYILQEYAQQNDTDIPPDAARSRTGRIRGGAVDAESAWRILERSDSVFGVAPDTVLAVKNDEPAFRGMSPRTAAKCSADERNGFDEVNVLWLVAGVPPGGKWDGVLGLRALSSTFYPAVS